MKPTNRKTLTLKVSNNEILTEIRHPNNWKGGFANFFCRLGGSAAVQSTKIYSTVEVDCQSIRESILKQMTDIKLYRQCDIERVIIGQKECQELVDPVTYIDEDFHYQIKECCGIDLFEVPIQIVPWYEGVLVVPKMENVQNV